MIGTIRKGATRWTDLAAEQAFQEAMKVSPNDVTLQLAMANFLLSAGRADESALVLERVTEKYPNRARANHALGVYYMRRGRLDEAERFLKRATTGAHDERSVAVLSLAGLYMDTMREDQARALLDSQISENQDTETSMRLARLELRANLRDRAVGRLDTIIAREPKATDAAVLKAQILLGEGALDQAVTLARSAVAAAPALAEARSTLGQALSLAGDKEGAFDQFAEAVRLSPGAGAQVSEFTRLALVLGRRKEALAFARDAARLNPNDPQAAVLPARAFVLARDYAAAEQELVALMRRTPASPDVHGLFGQVKAARGSDDAAKAAFAQALALAPDSLDALTGMALLEVRSNLGSAARRRVEKALAGHPRDSDYLQAAAQVYAADNDQSRADAMLREALVLDRSDLTAALSLLTPTFASQHPDEARRVLEQLLEVRPRAIEARYRLGQLYEQIGRTDAAVRQYQAVLVEAPRAETDWIRRIVLTRSRALEAAVVP
jgi:tetratricopeptide (TPR) repeat protein